MAKELTLVFFKPDAMDNNIEHKIIDRFEKNDLRIASFTIRTLTKNQCDEHYEHIKHLDFYNDMKEYITSREILFLILSGEDAINKTRMLIGPTRNAPVGTIRGDYGSDGFKNLIHSSDSYESAIKEIARFFY